MPYEIVGPVCESGDFLGHDRSLAWMSKVARSVRMFLEYLQSNPAERDTYRLFQNFAQRLYTGTFDDSDGRWVLENQLVFSPGNITAHNDDASMRRLVS